MYAMLYSTGHAYYAPRKLGSYIYTAPINSVTFTYTESNKQVLTQMPCIVRYTSTGVT